MASIWRAKRIAFLFLIDPTKGVKINNSPKEFLVFQRFQVCLKLAPLSVRDRSLVIMDFARLEYLGSRLIVLRKTAIIVLPFRSMFFGWFLLFQSHWDSFFLQQSIRLI